MTYEEVMKKANQKQDHIVRFVRSVTEEPVKPDARTGAKGVGDVAMRNYDAWKEIRINMDTICENVTPDTSIELFGEKFAYPFLQDRRCDEASLWREI